jgi:hypothetical protein
MDELGHNPGVLTRYSIPQFIEQAGAQGVEFLNWMAMRGALTGTVSEAHRNYHIPISNTAAATMVLENVLVTPKAHGCTSGKEVDYCGVKSVIEASKKPGQIPALGVLR